MNVVIFLAIMMLGLIAAREALHALAPHLGVTLHKSAKADGPMSGMLTLIAVALVLHAMTALAIAYAALTLMGDPV